MRTSIWLIRHGQTEYNRQRRYQGSSESPLTPFGAAQAAAVARRLRRIPFTHAFVSPSGRTHATAAAILAGRDLAAHEDPRWAETAHGRWEGLTYAEVVARFREEAARRFADQLYGRAEGGESLAEVQQRVAAAWNELLREHPGGRILIVTHATPIQLIMCAVGNLPPTQHWRWRIDLGSITAIDMYGAGPIVRGVNEVPRPLAQQRAPDASGETP
jgi:2,3-bisphosphoglycerate-dependent phosphoglycerate mutase/probable phosphoglycerate mutase